MNPEERDEELLQEYLAGDSPLSRLYRRGAAEQPGADLDARIRGEARRALARKRRVAHSPFSRHWMVPASLAAVLVLSVSIVLLKPEPPGRPGGGAADEADSAAREAAGGRRDVQPMPAAEPAAAPAERAPASAEIEQRREQSSDSPQSNAPGASVGAASRQVTSGKPQAAGVAPEPAVSERKVEPALRKKSAAENTESAAPSAPGELMSPALEESAATPPPQPMPAAAVSRDPKAWLDFIAALLAKHDEAGARSNLRAFRARYPDFPLPADLTALAASLDAERP